MLQFLDELMLILLLVYVADISYRVSGWFAKRSVMRELSRRRAIELGAPTRSEPMSFGPAIFSHENYKPQATEKLLRELAAAQGSSRFSRARQKRTAQKIRGASGTVKNAFMLDPMDRGVVLEGDDGRTYEGWKRGRVVVSDVEYSAIVRPGMSSRGFALLEGSEVRVTDVAISGNLLYVIVEPAEAESRSKNQPQ